MNLTCLQYYKYLRFACAEELERLSEFLYGIDNNYDASGDKHWVAMPDANCPPDKEDVEKYLTGRDMAQDFAIIDSDDEENKEELLDELRQLILYS